jgi:hypothetical protein
MEFFDQPRLAEARFTDDEHELTVALPRSLPTRVI